MKLERFTILGRILAVTAAAMLVQSFASGNPTPAHAPRANDLSGDWEITFVVTSRADIRDSIRRATLDSLAGRMRLERFKAPPPDPRYKEQYVWPGWRGDVRAAISSLLQVPPYSPRNERGPGPLAKASVRAKYRSSDSLAAGFWDDSAGVRFEMEAIGCSDCGNLFGSGKWQSGVLVGTWYQEFYGTGDSGRWRMRRVAPAPRAFRK